MNDQPNLPNPFPVPNGPLTPGPGPTYGPSPQQYGQPPAPTYGPPPLPLPPHATPVTGPYPPSYSYPPAPHLAVTGPPRQDYARWSRRAAAYLIDFAPSLVAEIPLLVAYFMFLGTVVSAPQAGPGSILAAMRPVIGWTVVGLVLSLAALGWTIYNRWIVGGRTGQSLGRRVFKLHLISEQTGQPIGALNAFARDLAHYLDGLAYVGYLWPLWDAKRQTFADMIMHTIVIDDRANPVAGSHGVVS